MNRTIPAPLDRVTDCRSCGGALTDVIAFGEAPLADRLMRPEDDSPEYTAPLTLAHCADCALCQIRETVTPRVLFGPDYPYYSSVSPALNAHFRTSAEAIVAARGLSGESLVIEAASNDGYMLSAFLEHGVPVLGVDPADGPVAAARARGVETIHDFFSLELTRSLGRRADVFLANNVLAHVADVNDFVAGIEAVLAPDGIAVMECHYLLDLIDLCAFDTIYHQHLAYFSLTALAPLFARHGLHLNDAERVKAHGGSLRLFVSRDAGSSAGLTAMLAEETRRGVRDPAFYNMFADRIGDLRSEVRAALCDLRAAGQRVVGYGAAAKSTTLLHHFGLGRDDLSVIHDKSQWKQGLEMPITRIPIAGPEALTRDAADVVLILAWNFAREIIADNAAFAGAGGRFLIPVPSAQLVGAGFEGVSL